MSLYSKPAAYFAPNHASALAQKDFVSQAIKDLLVGNCITQVVSQPLICNPLSVVDGSSKRRLVINIQGGKHRGAEGAIASTTFKSGGGGIAPLLLALFVLFEK